MTSSFLALGFAGIIVLMGMGILKKRKFKANFNFFGFNFGMESED
ncbi:hypothetical protein [Chryseobacterium shandongense]|jgi:hypothetical protein|nr:hypothetical protein [Chryseobacterium shandongense]